MYSVGIVSTLAEQMLEAKARAEQARASGKDARAIESINRSLRQTLACIVQLRDPREVAIKGFNLLVKVTGEILVRHHEWVLPVSSGYLMSLLAEAGVKPAPGQIILLDAVVVKMLVEEALGALSIDQAEIRDWKSRLIKASLDADALVRVFERTAMRFSPDAA
jgi:hypothetical protein